MWKGKFLRPYCLFCLFLIFPSPALWSWNTLYEWRPRVRTLSKWKSLSRSDSLWPYGLYSPWNSLGQNPGVGSHSLLQGIFPTQGSNPGLPHCRQILHQLSYQGSPRTLLVTVQSEITTKAYWLASLESPSMARTEVQMLYLGPSLLCFSLDCFYCLVGSHTSSQQLQKESLYPYSFIFPILGLTDLAWVFCASLTDHYGHGDKMLLFIGIGLCAQPSKDSSHINQTNLQ